MPNFMTSLSRDPFVVLRSVFSSGAESSLGEFRLTKQTSRRRASSTARAALVTVMTWPDSGPRFAVSLIQINAAAGSPLNVSQGNGPDAVQFQNSRERDTACPPLATTHMDGRAAGAWKSLRFCF
jgi:hypothetical protein